jgi:2-polyprenyl-3-methyl-5-hydroxy-6-metoxy-1,4-benzoquinol methylase
MELKSRDLKESELRIGLDVPGGARLGGLKRAIARLLLPFLGYQVHVNRVLTTDVKSLATEVERRDALIELVQHQAFTSIHDAIGPMHADINQLEQRLDEATSAMKQTNQEAHAQLLRLHDEVLEQLEKTRQLQLSAERAVRTVWPRIAQLDLFLNEVRRSLPNPPAVERLAELPSAFDELYPALEEAFRGSPEDIRQRLSPYVGDVVATSALGPVLDVGCGRGEFLKVLADAGIDAYGVDLIEGNVDLCRAMGLRAEQGDALVHLAKLTTGSLRAIAAIHVIEHLEFNEQVELIDRAFAALAPGGILLLETPNPENLVVASSTFHLDPSHRRPVPPALLEFLVGARGFAAVEVRRLERPGWAALEFPTDNQEAYSDPGLERLAQIVKSRFTAAPDYAVIGRKLA